MKSYIEEKRIRPDILTSMLYWSIVIIMVYNIISVKIFGDKGAGYFAGPMALFFLFYVSFVLAVQKSVYVMVRLRARRSQFLNAEASMRKSMNLFVAVGIVLSVICMLASLPIARVLFGSGRSYFQVIIVAACLIFLCPQGVIRGYLQGLGYTKPIFIADIIISVTASVVGAVVSGFLFSYGKKVNELFHVDEYSAIYGASGMMIGFLVGSIVGLIQISISLTLRKSEINEIVKAGAPKYLDNKNDVLTGIRIILLLYVTPILMCLVDNIVYIFYNSKNGNVSEAIGLYGAFSGRVISIVVLMSFLCSIPFIKSWNRVMARVERDELEGARDRLKKLIRFESMLLIPVCVFIFTVSETLQVALFGKSNPAVNSIIHLGSLMILLAAIALFCSWLLNHMGKSMLIIIDLATGWVVHIVLLIVLFLVLKLGLMGIMLSFVGSYLIYDILCIFMIFKMLKYKQELVRTFCIPLIAAAISGLVLFLINLVFVNIIGDVLTVLAGALVYTILYMILLIFLRGIKTHELYKIPFGRLFVGLSEKIQKELIYEE
jgi:O-antigen/teichoic acid export membrane protein